MPGSRGKTDSWEIYSQIKGRPPLIVRTDGRGFRKLLENRKKPYDIDFAKSIVSSAIRLFDSSGLSPALAFVFSDEVNLLFLDAPFGARVEKIDSIIASFISGVLSLDLGRAVSMDSRVIPVCKCEVAGYLKERQDEAWRNHVFSYGFYMLVGDGISRDQAMSELRGMKEREIHELAFRRGVNLAKTPAWERRGVLVYRKDGKITENWELPLFGSDEGKRLLEEIIRERYNE
ncbi:MAG: tRNA(His) guanylyltransferase Thg1 family protein [Methanotrichaceae archaeon]